MNLAGTTPYQSACTSSTQVLRATSLINADRSAAHTGLDLPCIVQFPAKDVPAAEPEHAQKFALGVACSKFCQRYSSWYCVGFCTTRSCESFSISGICLEGRF